MPSYEMGAGNTGYYGWRRCRSSKKYTIQLDPARTDSELPETRSVLRSVANVLVDVSRARAGASADSANPCAQHRRTQRILGRLRARPRSPSELPG